MDREPHAGRAPGRATLAASLASAGQPAPGKRTLCEAASPDPAAPTGAPPRASGAATARDPGAAPRPTLAALFGHPVQQTGATAIARHGSARSYRGSLDAGVQTAAARGVATPAGALPHGEAIQRAFGHHDLSLVQAHVGGDATLAARAIGAAAYTTGDHVVLGDAADLFTAAHEAAHVVQQRAGVQLSGGVGQAGDAHERNADAVAARVSQGLSAEHLLPGHAEIAGQTATVRPVQRQAVAYHEDSEELSYVQNQAAVAAVVRRVVELVDGARPVALDWRNLINHSDPHVSRWASTADKYYHDTERAPDFIHAWFGYAIEALACEQLAPIESGLTVDLQVAVGATRPDIVLSRADEQIAWLDITSSDSQGHIFGKSHSAWQTRPFVYEILYEPLQLPEVLTGTKDPVYGALGRYRARQNQIRYIEENRARNQLHDALMKLRRKRGWTTGVGDSREKQQATRDCLADKLGFPLVKQRTEERTIWKPKSMIATRGALALVDLHDGPFGFNTGDVRQSNRMAKTWASERAAPAVARQVSDREAHKLGKLHTRLRDHNETPLVDHLLASRGSFSTTAAFVKSAIAVNQALQVRSRLQSAQAWLASNVDPEDLALHVMLTLGTLPTTSAFDEVRDWAKSAAALADDCEELQARAGTSTSTAASPGNGEEADEEEEEETGDEEGDSAEVREDDDAEASPASAMELAELGDEQRATESGDRDGEPGAMELGDDGDDYDDIDMVDRGM
jgi:hypothetical protein